MGKEETDRQREIILWVNQFCHWAIVWRASNIPVRKGYKRSKNFNPTGMHDIIGFFLYSVPVHSLRGKILSIEVKSEAGDLTPEQLEWQKLVNSAGGLSFMARSCEDVHRRFRMMGLMG